jgi:hypothetical protein
MTLLLQPPQALPSLQSLQSLQSLPSLQSPQSLQPYSTVTLFARFLG